MSTFLLNVPPNQNFGDAIAVQDLSENFVRGMKFCPRSPPTTKILEPLLPGINVL